MFCLLLICRSRTSGYYYYNVTIYYYDATDANADNIVYVVLFTSDFCFHPAIRSIGRDIKFTVLFVCSYDYISDKSSPILERIAPGMAGFWASTGAI